MKENRIAVYLDNEVFAKAIKEANEIGLPVSVFIRTILMKHLANQFEKKEGSNG